MQYLLSKDEYEALQRQERMRTEGEKAKLQELCTLAAQHIPIVVEWSHDKTPRPWGCILGSVGQDPGYCDRCPAREVCPSDRKEWSQ